MLYGLPVKPWLTSTPIRPAGAGPVGGERLGAGDDRRLTTLLSSPGMLALLLVEPHHAAVPAVLASIRPSDRRSGYAVALAAMSVGRIVADVPARTKVECARPIVG